MEHNKRIGIYKRKNKVKALLETIQKEEKIAKILEEKSALAEKHAIELLSNREDALELIEDALKEDFFIKAEKINELILKKETKLGIVGETKVKVFEKKESAEKSNFRILKEYDVTGKSYSEGKVQDFLQFFQTKFLFLENILKKRAGINAKPLNRLPKIPKGREVNVIAMVREKFETKNKHVLLRIEDMETECSALVLSNDAKNQDFAKSILLDEVLAVKATRGNNDLLIVKEFVRPDLQNKQFKKSERDLNLAIISDIHIGSKMFLEKEFGKFIEWINGMKEDTREVEKIKYLVIAGDCVDGIGVYPNQFEELSVKDVKEQYKIFSEYVKKIPERIEIFICPGQHDAVRRADPQPAISKEYVPELYERKNIHFIGSPGWVEIEGLKVLIYHGASLHDMYAKISGLNARKPELAMIEVLKRRDFTTGYGQKQPYVPEKKNYMIIREEPDIYIGGDMHHTGYGTYRGTMIINSGTFQGLTKFQISEGHVPTPGIVPVMNLKSGTISEYNFSEEKK